MQSITLCLGKVGKLSEETKQAMHTVINDEVRDSFLSMSKVSVSFGAFNTEALLTSFEFSVADGRVYLECGFTSKEEGGW